MDIADLVHQLSKAEKEVRLWPIAVDLQDGETPRRVVRLEWDDQAEVVLLIVD